MEKSAEDVLQEHIEVMGDELGRIYNSLTNEVNWIHEKWNIYQQLYMTAPERIKLLNKVASHFFGVIQDVQIKDVILHLATLTDPPKSAGKDNLTLQRLPILRSELKLSIDVNDLVNEALVLCKPFRVWRNSEIAHRKLEHATASATEPLPDISYADIKNALAAILAVINSLEHHYFDSQIIEDSITHGNVDSLVKYLSQGVKAEKEQHERDLIEKY